MIDQGLLDEDVFAFYLGNTDEESMATFGGIDKSKLPLFSKLSMTDLCNRPLHWQDVQDPSPQKGILVREKIALTRCCKY